jgi:hypothetical protein
VGIGLGYLALRVIDSRAVAVIMAMITLTFTALWFLGGGEVTVRPRSTRKAIAAGVGSGVTSMVAHSGGPPLAMYGAWDHLDRSTVALIFIDDFGRLARSAGRRAIYDAVLDAPIAFRRRLESA